MIIQQRQDLSIMGMASRGLSWLGDIAVAPVVAVVRTRETARLVVRCHRLSATSRAAQSAMRTETRLIVTFADTYTRRLRDLDRQYLKTQFASRAEAEAAYVVLERARDLLLEEARRAALLLEQTLPDRLAEAFGRKS